MKKSKEFFKEFFVFLAISSAGLMAFRINFFEFIKNDWIVLTLFAGILAVVSTGLKIIYRKLSADD